MEYSSSLVIDHSATVKQALESIGSAGLGIVFVVDEDGSLYGTVTDGDVRRSLLQGIAMTEPVRNVANTDPVVAYDSWNKETFDEKIDEEIVRQRVNDPRVLIVPVLDENDRIVSIAHVNTDGKQIGTEPI